MELLTAAGRRLRESAKLLRRTASRNINEETEDKRTTVMRAADWISDFSGSLPFLFIHCGLFFVWIILNTGPLARTPIGGWDAFPYGLLTMCVSLEAIILSVFVLLSQNRQVARDRVRNDIEYEVNLKAELEIAHLHEKFDHLHAELLERLSSLEKPPRARAAATVRSAEPTRLIASTACRLAFRARHRRRRAARSRSSRPVDEMSQTPRWPGALPTGIEKHVAGSERGRHQDSLRLPRGTGGPERWIGEINGCSHTNGERGGTWAFAVRSTRWRSIALPCRGRTAARAGSHAIDIRPKSLTDQALRAPRPPPGPSSATPVTRAGVGRPAGLARAWFTRRSTRRRPRCRS